jgi:membrane protease YdiL (CAAX protease family)
VTPTPPDDARARRLDDPRLVGAIYAGSVATLAGGMLLSSRQYADLDFAAEFFGTELFLAIAFGLLTVLWLPAARLGVSPPRVLRWSPVVPVLVLCAGGLAAWLVARATLPPGAAVDPSLSLRTLRSTALVGFTEEWMYRGLLLSFLTRLWGLRRGAFGSLAMFSGLHALNVLAGSPPLLVLGQVCMTFVIGAVFTLSAIGTRSIWLGVLVHGLHDFFAIDVLQLSLAGSASGASSLVAVPALLMGLWSIGRLWRLERVGEAFPVAGARAPDGEQPA